LLPARGTGPTPAGSPRPFWRSRGFWIYLVVLLAINYILTFVFMSGPARITVPYTTFIQQVSADNVKDITAQANSIQGDFKTAVRSGSASGTLFQTERPVFATDNLETLLEQHNVPITATAPGSGGSPLLNILLSFGPAILLIGGFLYLSRRAAGAGPGHAEPEGRPAHPRGVRAGGAPAHGALQAREPGALPDRDPGPARRGA